MRRQKRKEKQHKYQNKCRGEKKMYLNREMYTYHDMECFGKMVSQWFRKK